MPNKIGWCDMTWNPVWGCLNNCEYCYARGIAKRFFPDMQDFKPTWIEKYFNKKFPKKPQRIFVGSMSEIHYWKPEWIVMIIEKVKQYPQHTFQFLTKHPETYIGWNFPENCWLGITITKETDISEVDWHCLYGDNKYFISFEPLLEEINLYFVNPRIIDWVIIGAETGNRNGKVIPEPSWIDYIVSSCMENNIPIYLKDSLKNIYPVEIKEFPNGKETNVL